jgi:adenylate kinase
MTAPQLFLVFLGPPGSGKGTQARLLHERIGLPHVSTGDLFRHHLKNNTPLGLLARQYMDRGELVPDGVTVDMVADRLAQPDAACGAILDGFPRNLAQATALEAMLAARGGVSLVPLLDVPDEEVLRRITGRRTCRLCGAIYHIEFSPPVRPGVCDADGGELYQRDDDRPETVQKRLYVYYKQTGPLIGYYFAKGLLAEIDGTQSPEAVQDELVHLLTDRGLWSATPTVAAEVIPT